jgi:hypothetical protein
MFPNFAAVEKLFGRELLQRLLGNPGHVQQVSMPDDPWGRGVPIALLEHPSAGIRRLMVGPLCCGGFLPPDHELSCLVLTAADELVWLDLPIKRLLALRDGAELPAPSADSDVDDLLEFGLGGMPSHMTPHHDWREPARWRVPGGDDPGPGVPGAWYRLVRRRTLARGQGELTPRSFLRELHERIDHGVDWVIDGLPPLQAELVRTRAMHLPLINKLLAQAQAHPHPEAERFAEQALRTLPLGLLGVLAHEQHDWRDTLLSGASLRKALALQGVTPAVYRLMLRGRERGLADGLLDASSWRVACRALKLIEPADWPRTPRDQQRFARLVERVEWEAQHELGHPLIAWCWTPGLNTHQLSVEAVRRAARQLVVMEDALDLDDAGMVKFVRAILQQMPPISRTPRAQRQHWVDHLQKKLQSRRVLRQLWHAVKGADVLPAAERVLALASSLPAAIELPGAGWFKPQTGEQAIHRLGAEAGNCLEAQSHALHYLSAGHVIGRVEDDSGLLLGVLAMNVREGLVGSSDEQMCEWQPVGSEKSLVGVGVLEGRLGGLRAALCEGARALNTFEHLRASGA